MSDAETTEGLTGSRLRPGIVQGVSLFLALLLLAGCVQPAVDPMISVDLSKFTKQELAWEKCAGGECARVLVPLDYAKPEGETLKLKVLRSAASKGKKRGTIFVNPGGPGAPGSSLAPALHASSLADFDLVGWDPRGTGESSGLICLDSKAADAFSEVDNSPDDEGERKALVDAVRGFGAACLEKYPELIKHISTMDTARDLEILRQLVGDEKLNYIGFSYGTYLGAVYATMFPEKSGILVLDAPMDMTPNTEVIQAEGFDTAFRNFAKWCVGRDNCSLGKSQQEVVDAVTKLLDELDEKPLRVGDRRLTQSLAVTGIAMPLYGGERGWNALGRALADAKDGDGQWLLHFADNLNGRAEDGSYEPLFSAFPAISCLDKREGTLDQMWAKWDEDQKKAPIFGKYFGPDSVCASWPVPSVQEPKFGPLAGSVVLIAATGDNATPYQGGVNSAKLFEAPLVTFEGEGHGTFGGSSKCVDDVVEELFQTGKLPKDGLVCR